MAANDFVMLGGNDGGHIERASDLGAAAADQAFAAE